MELNTKLEWLEQLCQIDGVSGAEDRVAEWILAICRRIAGRTGMRAAI